MPTLGLTWRDAVSTAALALAIIAYFAYLVGATVWLVSSPWATTAVVLALCGACAVSGIGDLYTRPQPPATRLFRGIATGIGTIALIAGLIGLLAGSAYALRILVMTTIVLWGMGTVRHASTIGSDKD